MAEPIFNLWTADNEYQRLVFGVYWDHGSPSFEVFYLKSDPPELTPQSIATVEELVLDRMIEEQCVGDSPMRAIFIAGTSIVMSASDLTAAGNHLIVLP